MFTLVAIVIYFKENTLNIAFVNSTKKWGGVKTWTLEFASALEKSGHEVYLYARAGVFLEKAQGYLSNLNAVNFGTDYNPFCINYFLGEFKKHKIEIVVLNVGKDLTTAGVAARLLNIPVVQRIGLPNDIAPSFKAKLLNHLIKPYYLCPCEFIANGFIQILPWVERAKVKIILNGKVPTTRELQANSPRQLIVTQQLNPDKCHAVLFKALAQIEEPFILNIVGTGKCEAELKALANTLGLENKIIWHGFSTKVPKLLAKADIFLMASVWEGLPNTLLEALSEGLLPICRNVGGSCEVWSEQLAPWMLPFEADENEFRSTIQKALTLLDEELLASKRAALEACRNNCNFETQSRLFEKWLLTFQSVN